MLRANSGDSAKIENKVCKILRFANAENKDHVFVNERDFYRSCNLSKLPRSYFIDEVGDILTYTQNVIDHGLWVIAEYGDGLHVFCKVPRKVDFEFKFEPYVSPSDAAVEDDNG